MNQTNFSLDFENRPSPNLLTALERDRRLADPGFGRYFTDHMVSIEWDVQAGWHDARVEGMRNLSLPPAASVFHYAPEIFEGMKAYRWADGSVHLFRPELNAKRFLESAERIALPQLGEQDFITAVAKLVDSDREWVPSAPEHSLYIRPFMFANEPYFGIRATQSAEFHVIAAPAGNYFSAEVRPVRLWVEDRYSRASKKGTGAAKFGGNYAASALPQRMAHEQGFDQVLFLDAESGSKVDEAGSMNVFFLTKDNVLVTPELTGGILNGITRRSIMQLSQDRGLEVQERAVDKAELFDGSLAESFAAGTAAVITPIASFTSADQEGILPSAKNSLALELRAELTGIQWGLREDCHGWMREVQVGGSVR